MVSFHYSFQRYVAIDFGGTLDEDDLLLNKNVKSFNSFVKLVAINTIVPSLFLNATNDNSLVFPISQSIRYAPGRINLEKLPNK